MHAAYRRLTSRCCMAPMVCVWIGLKKINIDVFLLVVSIWWPANGCPNISIRPGAFVAMALQAPATTSLKRPIYLYLPNQLKQWMKSLDLHIIQISCWAHSLQWISQGIHTNFQQAEWSFHNYISFVLTYIREEVTCHFDYRRMLCMMTKRSFSVIMILTLLILIIIVIIILLIILYYYYLFPVWQNHLQIPTYSLKHSLLEKAWSNVGFSSKCDESALY